MVAATSLARLLRQRKISAVTLLDHCLDQYAKHNARLNAIIVTDIDQARRRAAAADRRLKAGKPLGPFDGVPMTAKESFDWIGTPSTCARSASVFDAVRLYTVTACPDSCNRSATARPSNPIPRIATRMGLPCSCVSGPIGEVGGTAR